MAAAGRLGHGGTAGHAAQKVTRRTVGLQQELRCHNVRGGAKAAVAASGRLVSSRAWSRDEESVLIDEYSRLGNCLIFILHVHAHVHVCMRETRTETSIPVSIHLNTCNFPPAHAYTHAPTIHV